ncbi:MAG: hypothetical protein HXY20_11650 [Acidobacteria bacterium]|nr:hypothetical protein [Acidobacteriota bacterium]
MNLRGSLSKLLKNGSIFYREKAQQFDHNPVIREAWSLLAQDMDLQTSGLKGLPASFWREIQVLHPELMNEVRSCLASVPGKNKDGAASLQDVLNRSLSCEEPIILRVFVPVIRKLRASGTGHALDFYVIVKAHVTHLNELVRAYCGDPLSIQRAGALLESFEKEVQRPEIVQAEAPRKSSRSARGAGRPRRKATTRPLKPSRKRAATRIRSISKPMMRKIRLTSRRVRR